MNHLISVCLIYFKLETVRPEIGNRDTISCMIDHATIPEVLVLKAIQILKLNWFNTI